MFKSILTGSIVLIITALTTTAALAAGAAIASGVAVLAVVK